VVLRPGAVPMGGENLFVSGWEVHSMGQVPKEELFPEPGSQGDGFNTGVGKTDQTI